MRVGYAGLILVLVAGSAVAGCSSDDRSGSAGTTLDASTTTRSAATSDALPPASALDLDGVYGGALAEHGLQLTDRGGLIDRTGGGYEPSTEGNHLALYVEPIGERSPDEYIDGILDVAVVFGDVFDRWPGLESYDVCQEPVEDETSLGGAPPPVTQMELRRDQAEAIDWDSVTLADLVAASRAEPARLALAVSSSLEAEPAYQELLEGG